MLKYNMYREGWRRTFMVYFRVLLQHLHIKAKEHNDRPQAEIEMGTSEKCLWF
jgi:hypothetical protein